MSYVMFKMFCDKLVSSCEDTHTTTKMARKGRDIISVCCMKHKVGNIVSDADGIKNIWRKYMEKLLNVENDWDGEVDCSEVTGPCCLISEEEVASAINGLK